MVLGPGDRVTQEQMRWSGVPEEEVLTQEQPLAPVSSSWAELMRGRSTSNKLMCRNIHDVSICVTGQSVIVLAVWLTVEVLIYNNLVTFSCVASKCSDPFFHNKCRENGNTFIFPEINLS